MERHVTNKEARQFHGPLFLVGLPRSGTKLLRELLNQHPLVGIPDVETEFLPYMVKRWPRFGSLARFANFERFYKDTARCPYFLYMQRRGRLIAPKTWYERCPNYDPAGVFEALVRHDAGVAEGGVWGDKSPSYIAHLKLIKELYPEARIVHIVRDVRDYCLSINKAWGKNMIRAAQRWTDCVEKADRDARGFSEDYMQVHYEQLIERPEECLRGVCQFLSIDFDPRIMRLSKTTENLGDTRGQVGIVKGNKDKYLQHMHPAMRRRVDSIAARMLRRYGYEASDYGIPHRVPAWRMRLYQAFDACQLVRSRIRELGIGGAVRFHLRYYMIQMRRSRD